jgi:hypothetical protein
VEPFDAKALADRATTMLRQPQAQPATMPAALGRYTLKAMQDATLAVYDEFHDAIADH